MRNTFRFGVSLVLFSILSTTLVVSAEDGSPDLSKLPLLTGPTPDPRVDQVRHHLVGLIGDRQGPTVNVVRIPETLGGTYNMRVTDTSVPEAVSLTFRSANSTIATAEVRVLGKASDAIDELAWIIASCTAPRNLIQERIGTTFGDVCLADKDCRSVIMVRNNVMVRSYAFGKETSVGEIVRALDAAILASVGLPRPKNGARFIYPRDLVASPPPLAPRPAPVDAPVPPKTSNLPPATPLVPPPATNVPAVPQSSPLDKDAQVQVPRTAPDAVPAGTLAPVSTERQEAPNLVASPKAPQVQPEHTPYGGIWIYALATATVILAGAFIVWRKLRLP